MSEISLLIVFFVKVGQGRFAKSIKGAGFELKLSIFEQCGAARIFALSNSKVNWAPFPGVFFEIEFIEIR